MGHPVQRSKPKEKFGTVWEEKVKKQNPILTSLRDGQTKRPKKDSDSGTYSTLEVLALKFLKRMLERTPEEEQKEWDQHYNISTETEVESNCNGMTVDS